MKSVRLQSGTMDYPNCWGMYSRYHLGISRILDQKLGLMADFPLSVGRVEPSAFISSDANFGYKPIVGGARRAKVRAIAEDVMPDLSSFSLRYFLDEHGDWCLAHYTVEDEKNVQCELEFFNSSDQSREYWYNVGMLVEHQVPSVKLRDDLEGVWVAGKNYSEIESYIKAFTSGARKCVADCFSFGVEKGQLAESFGCWDGDKVVYEVEIPEEYPDARLYLRYVKYGSGPMRWRLKAADYEKEFCFPQTCALESGAWGKSVDGYHEWKVLPVELGYLKAGKHRFEFSTVDPVNYDIAQIWLDGFYVSNTKLSSDEPQGELLHSDVLTVNCDYSAAMFCENETQNTVSVSVNVLEKKWHVALASDCGFTKAGIVRTDSYIEYARQQSGAIEETGEIDGSQTILSTKSMSIKIPPKQRVSTTFSIQLDGDFAQSNMPQYVPGCYGNEYPDMLKSSESPYRDLIKYYYDANWFNFCFPTTVRGQQTVFISPAKHFPTPYSWDAGFAALGMAELCPEFSAAGSGFYLNSEDSETPFIYWGSPVPTQFYSLWALFANQQCDGILHEAYASMVRMYEFFVGLDRNSNVGQTGSGLLSTYRYNYSLGIDDHPIQLWAYKNNWIKDGVYPLLLVAQVVRCAKIMRNVAFVTEHSEDIEKYNNDISGLESVIEDQMWDPESGLYGWLYNDGGNVRRAEVGGCQGDRSGCSMLPMFAGIMSHRRDLMDAIVDPKRFWTRNGISSVDMQAPYYNPSGYWNGGIWPVMNWFIWRAMIEAGELDFAREIVVRILDTWLEGLRREHYCGEHFNIAEQRMEGVSNFTGLDAVIVEMHNAYFQPYTVTLPFDVWMTSKNVDRDNDEMEILLRMPFVKEDSIPVMIVMNQANQRYAIHVNNTVTEAHSDEYGYMDCVCSADRDEQITLTVRPVRSVL